MTAEGNPTLARRVLAEYFSGLRLQRRKSLDDIAALLQVDGSQASRLDTGARGFRIEDVRTLAAWYDLPLEEIDRLVTLAGDARKRAWWQKEKLPNSYRTLIGLERGAESIHEFCQNVIPGYLQTREYAAAVVRGAFSSIDPDKVDHAADTRIRRQDILERATPPNLSVILDEAALARGSDNKSVMRSQLDRILDLAKRTEIEIRVLPFSAGLYPANMPQFILLTMPKFASDVLYSETIITSADTTDTERVRQGRQLWTQLSAISLNAADSVDLVGRYLDSLDHGSPHLNEGVHA